MAILRSKDIVKMTEKETAEKINDLRIEMIKARVTSKKGGKSNLKEIKRTIAKLLTAQNAKEKAKPKAEENKTETKKQQVKEAKK